MKSEVIIQHKSVLSCPKFHPITGQLHVASPNQGMIYKVEGNELVPTDVDSKGILKAFDFGQGDNEECTYLCDLGHQSIMSYSTEDYEDDDKPPMVKELVRMYDGKVFNGPTDIVVDQESGDIYFCDGGPIGETNLKNCAGSVFLIYKSELLHPLTFESLAYPSCIALKSSDVLFVGEMMKNRIIRFVKMDNGVFQYSVFCQLSGRIGPSALACDPKENKLYVSHFDSRLGSKDGIVLVLDTETGEVLDRVIIPNAPEINGLAISPDSTHLFVTEESTKSLFCTQLN